MYEYNTFRANLRPGILRFLGEQQTACSQSLPERLQPMRGKCFTVQAGVIDVREKLMRYITNPMGYGTRRFNAAFTRALQ
jgi:hypothetical protein